MASWLKCTARRGGRNQPARLGITASRGLRSTRVSSLSRLSHCHCPTYPIGQLAILLAALLLG